MQATPWSRPGLQALLQQAPVVGEVAAAVGGHRPGRQRALRPQRDQFRLHPRGREGQRLPPVGDEPGEEVGGLVVRVLLRLPQQEVQRRTGGGVGADLDRAGDAGEPFQQRAGVGDRRGSRDEHRVGPVVVGQPAESPQHGGDVRPEDAAVAVRLVDDDVAQRRQQPRPLLVAGQHRAVQHVGVGQDEPAEVAGEAPFDGVGVPVQRAHPPARKAAATRTPAAGRGPAPSSARGRSQNGRGPAPGGPAGPPRSPTGIPRSQPARAAGSRASCRTPCRWRARRADPRRLRPLRSPGAPRGGSHRCRRGPRGPAARPSRGSRPSRPTVAGRWW